MQDWNVEENPVVSQFPAGGASEVAPKTGIEGMTAVHPKIFVTHDLRRPDFHGLTALIL